MRIAQLLLLHIRILLRIACLRLRVARRSGRVSLCLRISWLSLWIALLLHWIWLPGISGLRRVALPIPHK